MLIYHNSKLSFFVLIRQPQTWKVNIGMAPKIMKNIPNLRHSVVFLNQCHVKIHCSL